MLSIWLPSTCDTSRCSSVRWCFFQKYSVQVHRFCCTGFRNRETWWLSHSVIIVWCANKYRI